MKHEFLVKFKKNLSVIITLYPNIANESINLLAVFIYCDTSLKTDNLQYINSCEINNYCEEVVNVVWSRGSLVINWTDVLIESSFF